MVGVTSVLHCFVSGTFCVVNFSLVTCNKSFNEAFGILKPFGGFCMQIKIGIPFSLLDLGTLAFN